MPRAIHSRCSRTDMCDMCIHMCADNSCARKSQSRQMLAVRCLEIDMCVDMFAGMCAGMCVGICVGTFAGMCGDLTAVCRRACKCACRYVCRHVCMHVCKHVCRHVCKHVCRHVCRHVCIHVCKHVCRHGCRHLCQVDSVGSYSPASCLTNTICLETRETPTAAAGCYACTLTHTHTF